LIVAPVRTLKAPAAAYRFRAERGSDRPVQARSSRSSTKARCSRRIVVLFMTMIAALPVSIERST
jgi:hypothetical protein